MEITSVDRISELPEPIRQQILSSLSQKDAVAICVLSKLWLHHWCTRPNVEFRQPIFNMPKFRSLVNKTLQRYLDQNLSIHEFRLQLSTMYGSEPEAELLRKWIPKLKIFNIYLLHRGLWCNFNIPSSVFEAESLQKLYMENCTLDQNCVVNVLCKHLKSIHLEKVNIAEEAFKKIILSCPLIESITFRCCHGLKTNENPHNLKNDIPSSVFEAESLEKLYLEDCTLDQKCVVNVLCKHLKSIHIEKVNIADDALEKIISSCPLIESVTFNYCRGFGTTIKLDEKLCNLKHFEFTTSYGYGRPPRIEFDVPNAVIERIKITCCDNLWFRIDYQRNLKSLSLKEVRLSSELVDLFSWNNMPSLEFLEIVNCQCFKEFRLSSRSIKHLSFDFKRLPIVYCNFKATIDAPNILCFKYSSFFLPSLFSFTTNSSHEWKSKVRLYDDYDSFLSLELYELLKELSGSEISLELSYTLPWNREITRDRALQENDKKPVEVEYLKLWLHKHSIASRLAFLNKLFDICHPRILVNARRFDDFRNEFLEMDTRDLCQQELEDVSMETYEDRDGRYYHDCFQLKWREI